jgi:hypothetical protein
MAITKVVRSCLACKVLEYFCRSWPTDKEKCCETFFYIFRMAKKITPAEIAATKRCMKICSEAFANLDNGKYKNFDSFLSAFNDLFAEFKPSEILKHVIELRAYYKEYSK